MHVLQGERPMAKGQPTLGQFNLEGIPPAPRGVPQIEVTFDIDANGIVNVSARDKATGKEQKITITASSGLEESEVEKLVKDAEAHESEDQKRKEEVELRNRLDTLVYQLEKQLRESGENLPAEPRGEVEQALTQAKQALSDGDANALRQAEEELNRAAHKLAQEAYGSAADGPQPGPQAEPQGQDDGDVIDAEYEEVKRAS